MCLTTTCVYAIMASGGGWYQHVYFPNSPTPPGKGSHHVDGTSVSEGSFTLRQNFYVRFVDWSVNLPITILVLTLLARLKPSLIILCLAFTAVLLKAVTLFTNKLIQTWLLSTLVPPTAA